MLTLFFDRDGNTALYEQLYQQIRELILERKLVPGSRMPSKRELAKHLKISVQTIETAYQQLLAEGYIRSYPRKGYFVEQIESGPVRYPRPKTESRIVDQRDSKIEIDFRTDVVDHKKFPYLQWARLEKEIILDDIPRSLNTQTLFGYMPLRNEIAKYLFQYRGIVANPDNIMIGSGTDHLLMTIKFFFCEKFEVAIENPVYLKLARLYEALGAEVHPVNLDGQGFAINEIENVDINLVHVTPSHQFPSGKVMPVARRMEVLKWASGNPDRYVIEDDYDSEFRFSGNPIPALKSMDYSENVIYMNSFTKSIAPSMRVSFMVLPVKLAELAHSRLDFLSCPVALLNQVALCQFLARGLFERHLNRMKTIYKNKRDTLIEALKGTWLKSAFDLTGFEAGLHFLMVARFPVSEATLIEKAGEKGVRIRGMHEYHVRPIPDAKPTIVLGYSDLTPEAIQRGVGLLAVAWKPLFGHQ